MVLVEKYDHSLAFFGPQNLYSSIPAYGLAHPNTTKFPNFRLVYVKLVEPDNWYQWYWVNDRASQEDYNFQISYPYGDTAYPRYERTTLVRRSTYSAGTAGSADPVNSALKLVKEELLRTGDEVLDSLYVYSKRTYERIPSPWISDISIEPETRAPIVQKSRWQYAPDYLTVSVSDGVANGTTTLTSASAAFAQTMVGSLISLGSGATAIYRTIVTVTNATTVVLDATVTAGTGITIKIGSTNQVPYYDHLWDGSTTLRSIEQLRVFNNGAAPASRIEHGFAAYTFPTLVFGFTGTSLVARDGSGRLLLNAQRRSAFSQIVPKRTVISYGPIGTLTVPTVFSPTLNDLVFDAEPFFSINEQNVLNDEISLSFTTGTKNPKWPYIGITYDADASDLSASDYWDMVVAKEEICIGAVVAPWRYGLERMEAVYVTAR